jgi:YVTN family beta-propeller protein
MKTDLKRVALLGAALAASACATTATSSSRSATPLVPNDVLYVANQGAATVTVVDVGTLSPVRTLDLQEMGFGPNAKPHHIVVEPDGSYWYLSLIGENLVLKLTPEGEIVARGEFQAPGMLALAPTDGTLFVGRSMSAVNPPPRVGVINRSTMAVEELGVFFPRPHALAFTPDGDFAYTASLAENQFASIEIAEEELALVQVDGPPHTFVQFAVSPDGSTLVAATQLTGKLLFYDLADPASPQAVGEIDVGGQAWHPVITPDGRWIYVGSKGTNTITIIDARSMTVAKVLTDARIRAPHGSSVSADGRYVFISNSDMDPMASMSGMHAMEAGTVTVIDVATQEVVGFVPVGVQPTGIGTRSGR